MVKLLWESFLSANNALTKTFLFNSHPDFTLCGLFLCPWSLGRPKECLREPFRALRFDWKLLKEYLYFVQKSTFFQGVSPGFLVKNDQILESAFFTCFIPLGILACDKTPLGIILSANNALTKNILFNSNNV